MPCPRTIPIPRNDQFLSADEGTCSGSLPGVAGVGTIDILPLQGGNTTRFYVEAIPIPAPDQAIEANIRVADETYFQTIGIPLLAGRAFDGRDHANAPGVVIIW